MTEAVKGVQESQDQYLGLNYKARKYCLLAITNILMKSSSEHIFIPRFSHQNQKKLLLEVLMDNSYFQQDPQMNLRFLTLVRLALKQTKQNDKHRSSKNEDTTLEKLIEFITDNIYQFRNILEAKESYYYEIPAITSKNSDNLDVPEPTKVNLNQSVDMQAQDKQVDFSEDVFPVVPGTMKANKSTMPRNVNVLSPM